MTGLRLHVVTTETFLRAVRRAVLKQRRIELGWKLHTVADVSGYSTSTVCRWEQGTSTPNDHRLKDWQESLGDALGS